MGTNLKKKNQKQTLYSDLDSGCQRNKSGRLFYDSIWNWLLIHLRTIFCCYRYQNFWNWSFSNKINEMEFQSKTWKIFVVWSRRTDRRWLSLCRRGPTNLIKPEMKASHARGQHSEHSFVANHPEKNLYLMSDVFIFRFVWP